MSRDAGSKNWQRTCYFIKVQHFIGDQVAVCGGILLLATRCLSPAFAAEFIKSAKLIANPEIGLCCKWFIIMTMLALLVVRASVAEGLPSIYAARGLLASCIPSLKGLS
jgi:hypothetical protein